jgi:hypothetical protein
MAVARVVTFEGVTAERVAQIERDGGQGGPEGLHATEVMMLHDPEAERALVVILFESEDDYARGDEVLNAMPADDTPGRRIAVGKYRVAMRRSA